MPPHRIAATTVLLISNPLRARSTHSLRAENPAYAGFKHVLQIFPPFARATGWGRLRPVLVWANQMLLIQVTVTVCKVVDAQWRCQGQLFRYPRSDYFSTVSISQSIHMPFHSLTGC
jgi:hypothetical protein